MRRFVAQRISPTAFPTFPSEAHQPGYGEAHCFGFCPAHRLSTAIGVKAVKYQLMVISLTQARSSGARKCAALFESCPEGGRRQGVEKRQKG